MATINIEAEAPASLDPHIVNLAGHYQSDPGDLNEGIDWRSARWTESFRFVPVAPWDSVNKVIAGIGVNEEGMLIIGGGIDLTGFMVGNAIDADKARLRELFNDRHRAVHRADVAKIILFLVEQWSGGKVVTTSDTSSPFTRSTVNGS